VSEPAEAPQQGLEQMVAAIAAKGDFPAAARAIQRLHDAVRRENCNALDVAQVILADPGLSSKVLRVVNSSFYRPRGEPVSTITRALFLLGFEAIRDLASGLLLIDEVARAGGGGTAIREVLHQCLLCGSVSRSLATFVGYPNPEEAYLLGLFANWGQLCLAAYYPDRYERALETAGSHATLEHAIGEEFGLASGDLATAMLALWNFPESYAEYFRQPQKSAARRVAGNGQRLFAVVNVANDYAVHALDPDPEVQAETMTILRAAETMFGRKLEDVQAAVEQGAEDAREHLPMLRSIAPKRVVRAGRAIAAVRAGVTVIATPSDDPAASAHAPLSFEEGGAAPASATFEILAEITRAILAQQNINDTLAMVLEGVARAGCFDVAFLAFLNGKKDHLVGRLGYGEGVTAYLSALQIPLVPDAGVLAESVLAREPKIVTSGGARRLVPQGMQVPTIPAASLIVHPLVVRAKAVGVLVVGRGEGRPAVSTAEVTVVQLFCNQAGLALDRAVG
jgi:eukaryotic-like serine/threonine-protein kinase